MPTPTPPLALTAAHRSEPSGTTAPAAPAQLINLAEVCRRTGLGRETIRTLILAGKFPPKIKDPDIRATRWSAQAVEQWILDRIARSTGGARR